MPREHMEITSKRCKNCKWSTGYHNWSPPGSPKIPDTYYCMNEDIDKVTPDCPAYDEPYNEEPED